MKCLLRDYTTFERDGAYQILLHNWTAYAQELLTGDFLLYLVFSFCPKAFITATTRMIRREGLQMQGSKNGIIEKNRRCGGNEALLSHVGDAVKYNETDLDNCGIILIRNEDFCIFRQVKTQATRSGDVEKALFSKFKLVIQFCEGCINQASLKRK